MKTKKNKFWTIFSLCVSVLVLSFGITLASVDFFHEEQLKPPSIGATGPSNTSGYWTDSGRYGTTAWSGSGTATDPYLIQSAKDLARLSYMVYNGLGTYVGNRYYQNTYFKQTVNIDLSAYYWQPIGISYNRSGTYTSRTFSGNYDGNGYTISGVFTRAGSGNAYSYQGLFGYVMGSSSTHAKISNLGVIDSYIQGYQYIGGIVGNTTNYFDMINCYNTGSVNGSGTHVGGVAGYYSSSTMTNCYNTGYVNGTYDVGGVVGACSSSTMTNCYNTGYVSGSGYEVGGVVGAINSTSTLTKCYNLGYVVGEDDVGGVVGNASSGTVTNCYYGGDCSLSKGVGSGTDTTSKVPIAQLDVNGGVLPDNDYLARIQNQGSASSPIVFDDCSYYISDNNIYIKSVKTSNNNTCFIKSVNAYLTANKSYTLSFNAVSTNPNVLNSHVDGGMFLNAGYDKFYHNDDGPIVYSTTNPVTMTHTFTPEVTGLYTLRIDTTLNDAAFRIYGLKLVENVIELNGKPTYVGFTSNDLDIPNPTRAGYNFKGWKLSGSGSYKSGYKTGGDFTPTIKQDSDGSVYTNYHNEWDKPSSSVWLTTGFPTYYFTPGHVYSIEYDYRVNILQVALDFRHSRVQNDYACPCGNPIWETTNGWVHHYDSQTLQATSDRGGEVETKPLFEIYTGDLSTSSTSKIIYDFDIKNIVITDRTTGTVAWSSNIYAFGSSNATLTAVWEANTYTVTLDKQYGTGGTSSVTATFGQAMPRLTSLPTKANYDFYGYYSGLNGLGTKYYNANGTSAKSYDLPRDATLYAYWKLKTHVVTLDRQGGTGGSSSVTATITEAMPPITPPTKEGHEFLGYFSEKNGGGTKYYNADGTSATTYLLDTGTTLYAHWYQITWIDYVTISSFGGGTGDDINDPYLISQPQHLALLAKNVNEGTTYSGKYFMQTTDLDMGAYPWMPIGTRENQFSGRYNGGNHKITNLNNQSDTLKLLGLFGYIDNKAIIFNVKISDSTFSSLANDSYVGGIVGDMGSISSAKCYIDNCWFDGELNGAYTGGIAGNLGDESTIANCIFTGSATGTTAVGGIVGWIASGSGSKITNSFNEGVLNGVGNCSVGGILGAGNITFITNCISNGNLNAESGYVGSIVGYLYVNHNSNISNCAGFGTIDTNTASKAACLFGNLSDSNQLNISNCSFNGTSNTTINAFTSNAHTKVIVSSCYAYFNDKGYYTIGSFDGFTLAENFNDGLPIQNALYAIGIWENRGDDILQYFTDNNFSQIS